MASFDDAGLAPLLGGADVDDRHPALHELFECGAVDEGDLRAKWRAAKGECGDEQNQPWHVGIALFDTSRFNPGHCASLA